MIFHKAYDGRLVITLHTNYPFFFCLCPLIVQLTTRVMTNAMNEHDCINWWCLTIFFLNQEMPLSFCHHTIIHSLLFFIVVLFNSLFIQHRLYLFVNRKETMIQAYSILMCYCCFDLISYFVIIISLNDKVIEWI